MSKRQMIEMLLEACEYAVNAEDYERQFQIWANRVASALAGAQMMDEYKAWTEAQQDTYFYSDDPSFLAHAESMKAILVGILDNVKQAEPSEELFSMESVEGTRNYIERIVMQANGCYQQGWYDACAVMIRRLVEILIVDCFERNNIASKIEDQNGGYYGLEKLISLFLAETTWHIPYQVKKHLPKLKDLKEIGDSAAHGRNITTRARIERLSNAIFFTFRGLVQIARFQ